MEIILVITGLIQLVIIIVVVTSIVSINKRLKQLSEMQSESYKKRNQAYSCMMKGLIDDAKVLMLDAFEKDIIDAIDNYKKPIATISPLSFVIENIDVILYDYKMYWIRCFHEENSKQIDDKYNEVIQAFFPVKP